jgi:predicted DNA binding CopG/RHH family protein
LADHSFSGKKVQNNKMKKKPKAPKSSLARYEQAIEDALDYKALRTPRAGLCRKIRTAAKATLRENKIARANIRMNEAVLEAIRVMAENSGMPYQTLINHIIHLYVTGQLIHAAEVRKLVKAGAFY